MTTLTRRGFFSGAFERNKITSGLNPKTQSLNRLEVAHLLRRLTFGVRSDLLNHFEGHTAQEVVDTLFQNGQSRKSRPAPFNVRESIHSSDKDKENLYLRELNSTLQKWWANLMTNETDAFLEKMTLFWHNHFVSEFDICIGISASSMWLQNDLFSQNFIGNFRTFLEKISIDGAMLIYLNGNENINEIPNENYARELMELFSLGVGNYTEQDIKEAAKMLTGWNINIYENNGPTYDSYLIPHRFDANEKLFMGEVVKVNYEITQQNVYQHSVKKLIDLILTKKGKEAAHFLCGKFYRNFVYQNPSKSDEAIIEQMAQTLLSNNFDIKPVLLQLFQSEHFYDPANVGAMIKSPAENLIGFRKLIDFPDYDLVREMETLGMKLLSPPNVAGWPGYRNWISTKTLPESIYLLHNFTEKANPHALMQKIKGLKNYTSATGLVKSLAEVLLPLELSAERLENYKKVLLGGTAENAWGTQSEADTVNRVKVLIKEFVRTPDYYLF